MIETERAEGFPEIVVETREIRGRDDLYRTISETARGWSGKTTIVAGHYMLVFRESTGELVPLLRSIAFSDPAATDHERQLVQEVGEFPETTFEMALELLREDPAQRRIALVVNDTHFRILQAEAPSGDELARLRRLYYAGGGQLPEPFLERLAGQPVAEVFERNDAVRPADHTLPPETLFFSEHILQKEFGRRRSEFARYPGFIDSKSAVTGSRLLYRPLFSGNEVCLINGEGSCDCSGATLELMFSLSARGARNVILFIPEECRSAVQVSLEATLRFLPSLDNVIAVWSSSQGPDRGLLGPVTFYERAR